MRIIYVLVCCLFMSTVSWSESLVVELNTQEHRVFLFEPLSVTVSILNTNTVPVEVAPLMIDGENKSIELFVVNNQKTNSIVSPELVLENAEGVVDFNPVIISSGKKISYTFLAGVDWESDKAIFSGGTNRIYCVYTNLDNERNTSNSEEIIVSDKLSLDEMKVAKLLQDKDVCRSLYIPDYLLLSTDPKETVNNV